MIKKIINYIKRFLNIDKYDIYLAGSMSGMPNHNYPSFMHYAQKLRRAGYTVWNPAEHNNIGVPPCVCMRNDIDAIINKCNHIVILPGRKWKSSVGVSTELCVAHVCGKRVFQIIENKKDYIYLKRIKTRDIRPYCQTKDKYRNDSIYSIFLNN